MPKDARRVRVFVSSPQDVSAERGRVQAVGAKLNRAYEGLAQIETVLWEASFYKADRTFQPQIPEATACDIVLAIFWTTVGTELPTEFARMPDGRPYPSGTAYELLTALAASKKRGAPDVYVFRKTADAALPTADAERRRQAQAHLDALEGFWNEWFESTKGQFKAAFHRFATTDAFEQHLEDLLRQWLQSHNLLGPRLAWPNEKGSPFRSLAPFEAEHATVFFGRGRAIDETRRRLVGAEERGTPFLLIVGPSGSGKSSLVRAGLIPRLTTLGVVASIDVWRVATMKPSEEQARPLLALATSLFAEGALPELSQGDFPDAVTLAEHFGRGGEAVSQPILRALQRVGAATQHDRHTDRPLQSALVLLVDQLEELFAKGVSASDRAAFAEALKQLVATRRVWIVATLRADLYELAIREPRLKSLKEAGASFDLGLPGPAELADIVRAPAQAAGLIFESEPPKGALDDRLLADAKNADSLPLLQFTLQHLYERRRETEHGTQPTHAAYDALGGLEGAIAAEAERAVSGLKPEAALPRLLRSLAEPSHNETTLTLREVSRRELESHTSEAPLVEALIAARILIARTDAQGGPTVRLAHDAVFTTWPRAKDAAQANREFYRVRAEVEDALWLWQKNGRPNDRLIPLGVPLAEAEHLVQRFNAELSTELTHYVRTSNHRARRRQRFERAAALFFFALAAAAAAASYWGYLERDRAAQALATITETGNTLVYDLGTESFVRGVPTDLMARMIDRAIQGYDQAIQLDPKNAVAYVSRGFAYMLKGDNDRAIQNYDQGIKLNPKNASAYRNRGVAYSNKNDNDRAVLDLDQAIQLDPTDPIAYVSRGTANASKGANERAIQDFSLAIQQDPTNAGSYIARGNAYKNKRDYDRAIQDYDQAIRLNSKYPFAYVGRGQAYSSEGDHDRAIQDYDQAIQLDPKNPKNVDAYVGRGDASRNERDYDRAMRDYDQAIQLDPKNASAYVGRGLVYASKSDNDKAIQEYDHALQLDPKNAIAYLGRGISYTVERENDRGLQDLDQAIELDPQNAGAHVARGAIYSNKGDSERAILDYDQAIKLDAKNAVAYLGRGAAYARKDDNARAIQDYDQAIILDPKNALAYHERGAAYMRKGDSNRAIQDYDRAIHLDTKNPDAYGDRGDAYMNSGDYDRAIQDYDQLIRLNPMNIAAHSNRGRSLFYQGNFRAAAAALSTANQLETNAYASVWQYLARKHAGEDGAADLATNAALLKSQDWPYPVIEMFLGRSTPERVLSMASTPGERCEAQFYIGEWHLLRANSNMAAAPLRTAAAICPKDFDEYAGAVAELKRLNLN